MKRARHDKGCGFSEWQGPGHDRSTHDLELNLETVCGDITEPQRSPYAYPVPVPCLVPGQVVVVWNRQSESWREQVRSAEAQGGPGEGRWEGSGAMRARSCAESALKWYLIKINKKLSPDAARRDRVAVGASRSGTDLSVL